MVTTKAQRHQGIGSGQSVSRQRESFRFAFPPICLLPALCLGALVVNCLCLAQEPYAAINHDAVNYNGPGRDARHDLAGKDLRIGLLLPLTGPRQAEGEALRRAAQMAIDEENSASLPGTNRLALVTRDENGPWGQASAQIVRMVFDDQALAVITSAEGGSAHLAEQVGNKVGVPVLTLSSDSTTTEINLPWIFRIGPTDAAQANGFARDIYQSRKLQRVLLLTQDDRDSKLGAEEFAKAARAIKVEAPAPVVVSLENLDERRISGELDSAQAVVIWSDAKMANLLLNYIRTPHFTVVVYLCHKAVTAELSQAIQPPCPSCGRHDVEQWIAASPQNGESGDEFNRRYRQRFGAEPGIGAAEAYDAVRVVAAALRKSGPNRVRLRDALAGVFGFNGASGVISFDHAGNDKSQVTLLKLE